MHSADLCTPAVPPAPGHHARPACTPAGGAFHTSPGPVSNGLKPDFARTLHPGRLTVPAADRDMFLTFKSSMTVVAWFLLTVVVTL